MPNRDRAPRPMSPSGQAGGDTPPAALKGRAVVLRALPGGAAPDSAPGRAGRTDPPKAGLFAGRSEGARPRGRLASAAKKGDGGEGDGRLGERLFELLGLSSRDPALAALLGPLLAGSPPCRCRPRCKDVLAHLESFQGDRAYLTAGPLGFELVFNGAGALISVFLHGAATRHHARFAGAPPKGLRFEDTRRELLSRLGPPARCSAPAHTPAWDRWDIDDRAVHCEYSGPDGKVGLITLMRIEPLRG
jgi:hypothetical protein